MASESNKQSMEESIEARVRAHLREHFPAPAGVELGAEQSLFDAGVLDSIGVLGLMTWLEREFSIFVEDHEVIPDNIDGIAALVRYIAMKRAEVGLDEP